MAGGDIRRLVSGSQKSLKGWLELAPGSRRVLAGKIMPLTAALALKEIVGKHDSIHSNSLIMKCAGRPTP